MALRVSVVLVAGVSIFGLMFRSLSAQAETTAAQTNAPALNASTAIMQDLFGVAGGSYPLLVVVAFVAGVLATGSYLK